MSTVSNNKPVVVVCAPTACGKTAFAQAIFACDADSPLAGRAEVISADSMQVYCGFNIGTAKPSVSLLKRLPHHLIDICSQRAHFGAGDFVRKALAACEDIYSRKKLPLIVGGTGFYIRNFIYALPSTPRADERLREKVAQRMETEGAESLWNELAVFDPVSAKKIHIHDEYRIKRAFEVYIASGKPLSRFPLMTQKREGFRFLILSLQKNRDELYERINLRVEQMFRQGLADEVKTLVSLGSEAGDPAMQAIGYREFFTASGGLETDTQAVKERIKKDSRAYAKRQQTFFKSLEDAVLLPADDIAGGIKKILEFFPSRFECT